MLESTGQQARVPSISNSSSSSAGGRSAGGSNTGAPATAPRPPLLRGGGGGGAGGFRGLGGGVTAVPLTRGRGVVPLPLPFPFQLPRGAPAPAYDPRPAGAPQPRPSSSPRPTAAARPAPVAPAATGGGGGTGDRKVQQQEVIAIPVRTWGGCPDGVFPVACAEHPCIAREKSGGACPQGTGCVASFCGGCTSQCKQGVVTDVSKLPTGRIILERAAGRHGSVRRAADGGCPPGVPRVQCFVNPCDYGSDKCPEGTGCVPNYCGGCNVDCVPSGGGGGGGSFYVDVPHFYKLMKSGGSSSTTPPKSGQAGGTAPAKPGSAGPHTAPQKGAGIAVPKAALKKSDP